MSANPPHHECQVTIDTLQERIRALERERDELIETLENNNRLIRILNARDDALAHRNNVLREALEPFAEQMVSSPEFKGDVPTRHNPSARQKTAIDALKLTPTQAEREVAAMKGVCEAAQAAEHIRYAHDMDCAVIDGKPKCTCPMGNEVPYLLAALREYEATMNGKEDD